MHLHTPSGIGLEITTNSSGAINIDCIVAPKTYTSYDEYLHGERLALYEIVTTLQGAGIFSNGMVAVPKLSASSGFVSLAEISGDLQNRKELKKKQAPKKAKAGIKEKIKKVHKVTSTGGIPPEDQKVIKTPAGGYMMIPDKAIVELFNTSTIITTGKVTAGIATGATKAFTVNGKRYVAGFDKKGNFTGYYWSKNMETKYVQEPVIYHDKVDDKFVNKLLEITYNLGYDPDKLMAVMALESGETFKPDIWNGTTAVGLIQFTRKALGQINKDNGTNYTMNAVSKMTVEEQLELVEKYYQQPLLKNKILKTIDDYAIANFAPAAVGKGENNILYTKNSRDKNEVREYEQNASLDINKDGNITNAEAASIYKAKYVKK